MLDFFFYITSIYDFQVIPDFYSAIYKERSKLQAETGSGTNSHRKFTGFIGYTEPTLRTERTEGAIT
jgi:hypothetical protein